MPKLAIISTQQHGGDQSTYYDQTLAVVDSSNGDALAKLRISIRTDSYAPQAYAKIEVWRDKWEQLHFIAGPCLATDCKLGYSVAYRDSADRSSLYETDRQELLRVALIVLGIKLTDEGSA
jgi:hypothetical protein